MTKSKLVNSNQTKPLKCINKFNINSKQGELPRICVCMCKSKYL